MALRFPRPPTTRNYRVLALNAPLLPPLCFGGGLRTSYNSFPSNPRAAGNIRVVQLQPPARPCCRRLLIKKARSQLIFRILYTSYESEELVS